jgi:hypothetical protein
MWLVTLLTVPLVAGAADPLPKSLGQWYKPENERQVWLHTMFAMRRELQAVREYAELGDGPRMAQWAQRLAGHYEELARMVPEWRDETDPALVTELLGRVRAADYEGTLRATEHLERDCRSCHRQYQALTALRYRWPRFDALQIPDGSGGERAYADHMEALSTTLNRVKIAVEDARWGTAEESLGELRIQLHGLGEGCQECHREAEPRERILGAASTATLDELGEAISAREPKVSGRLLGEAAVQICARCHAVHRLLTDVQRHLFDSTNEQEQ